MILGVCGNCKKRFRKRERSRKFCSLICANNFNLNCLIPISLPEENSYLAEFLGICLGDGHCSKYQTSIALNSIVDSEYIPFVIGLCKKLFPQVNPMIIKLKNVNMVDLRLNSRIISDFMRSMGMTPNHKFISPWILNKPEYITSCIRGLFDTEGSISFKTYDAKNEIRIYKQLNFRNYSLELMSFVRDQLVILGFKPTMSLKNSLYISNHDDIDRFREIIGFSNPKLQVRSKIRNAAQLHILLNSVM